MNVHFDHGKYVYIKLCAFLYLFLIAGTVFSQNISFEKYLANFKRLKLPLDINQEMVIKIAKNKDFMKDSVISKFIGAKFYPIDARVYLHHYFGCLVKNDSITAIIYLKTAIVQGEHYVVEVALYNSKSEKLIEKMLISSYSISDENGEQFSASEVGKDYSISTAHGFFKMTTKGFKVLRGKKEETADW